MGNGISLPAKLRPIFLQRLDEIRARRHVCQIKDPTPSKKELLLHGNIDDYHDASNNSYHHHNPIYNHNNVAKYEEPSKEKDHVMPKQEEQGTLNNITTSSVDEKKKKHEAVIREEKDHKKGHFNDLMEDSTDDEDDERMIGHDSDDAFHGSPSFRVYFDGDEKDQNPNGDGNNEAFGNKVSSHGMPLSKDLDLVEGKKVKKGRKRRSFKGVFPKGGQAAMKNLLNVRSCYTSSHTSHAQGAQTHLVSGKSNKHDS